MMTMTQRAGMVTDERGTQGTFGDFDRITATGSRDVWVGQLSRMNKELVDTHGLKLNNRISAIRNAKSTGQPPAIAQLADRQREVVEREKWLNEKRRQKDAIECEIFDLDISLTPFDFSKEKISEAQLFRLNDKLASMKDDERQQALKESREFRMAALKEDRRLSGLTKGQRDMLRQEEIARRFPDEVGRIALAREAARELETSFKTVQAAHDAEKRLCNLDPTPAPAEDKRAWA